MKNVLFYMFFGDNFSHCEHIDVAFKKLSFLPISAKITPITMKFVQKLADILFLCFYMAYRSSNFVSY